ncbi:MAG: fibronectin type III domain-containing protein, partial [Nocardioidaceae bacterium]
MSVTGIGASAEKMFATFSVSQTCAAVPSLDVVASKITGGCDLDPFLDGGETVDLRVTVRNFPTAAPATGISGTLTSDNPSLVTVESGTASFPDLDRGKFGEAIVPFRISASALTCSTTAGFQLQLTAAGGYSVTRPIVIRLGIDSLYVPITPFADDIESGVDNGWKHYAYINEDDWAQSTNGNHTPGAIPGHSWFTAAPPTGKDVSLEPPAFIPSTTSVVSFWHRYDTEDDWDGCVLELSTDGGRTWIDVGDLTNVGYDDAVMVNPQSSISGRRCWNGLNAGFPQFEQVTLPLATWADQVCLLRFRLASDLAATGVTPFTGLNIDDYQITDAAILRERCESTPVCGGIETDPPVFAGLQEATNPGTPGCDAVDLKWQAATDASGPITYLIYVSTSTPVPTVTPAASTTRLRHRVTGLEPNQTYYFLVRARDSQGNVESNQVTHGVTMSCEPPNLVVRSVQLVETAGCDDDGRADAGEFLSLQVTVKNAGATNATGVRGRLRTTSTDVLVHQDLGSWPDLPSQHYEDPIQAFTIKIPSTTSCLTSATLELDLFADGGYTATRTIDLLLESDIGFQAQDFFDDVEGQDPSVFTHMAEQGTDDWEIVTSDAYSPTHSWFTADDASVKNASLVSPPLFVSSNSVLTFRHKYIL